MRLPWSGSVFLEVGELSGERVAIAVKDTGIGIPQDDLECIFKEFWQVNQTMTRTYGGTGLGLAITHQLVSLMNGTLKVQSQLGQGSTFCVELPRYVSS